MSEDDKYQYAFMAGAAWTVGIVMIIAAIVMLST